MSEKKQGFNVSLGSKKLRVYEWTHPGSGKRGWRFGWHDGEKWRYVTRMSRAKIKQAAEDVIREMGEGLVWTALTPARQRFLERVDGMCHADDEEALLQWLGSRQHSLDVGEVVKIFEDYKVQEKGEKTPHLKNICNILGKFAGDFEGRRLADVHSSDISSWWKKEYGAVGEKRQKDVRGALVQMWKWARVQGYTSNERVTPAERLPSVFVPAAKKRVLTVDEMRKMLDEVKPEMRVNVVLSGFGGLRPEEVVPGKKKKRGKRGLRAEDIDWDFKVIRVPPEVNKNDWARIVPFNAALEAGLEWAGIRKGMTGAVGSYNMSDAEETKRLGKLLFGGEWPKDALRHTYGSMRNALLRSLSAVAEEMGTSENMMHKHYHNPRAKEEGEAWFSMFDEVAVRDEKTG